MPLELEGLRLEILLNVVSKSSILEMTSRSLFFLLLALTDIKLVYSIARKIFRYLKYLLRL